MYGFERLPPNLMVDHEFLFLKVPFGVVPPPGKSQVGSRRSGGRGSAAKGEKLASAGCQGGQVTSLALQTQIHRGTPIAGWFISWKISSING